MALIGISIGETFEYVLDRDPCKKTVEAPVDPDDPSQGKRTETMIEDGATALGVLDVFVMGMIYEGITYLETIGAAIMASPAWRWPEPAWIVGLAGQEIELPFQR